MQLIHLTDVNEKFDWNSLLPQIPSEGDIGLDLSGVHHVNSIGIRNFSLHKRIEKLQGRNFRLWNAQMVMIEQFGMCPGLAEHMRLMSFIVRYFCRSGHAFNITYDCEKLLSLKRTSKLDSEWRCLQCGLSGMIECTFDTEVFWKTVWQLKEGNLHTQKL